MQPNFGASGHRSSSWAQASHLEGKEHELDEVSKELTFLQSAQLIAEAQLVNSSPSILHRTLITASAECPRSGPDKRLGRSETSLSTGQGAPRFWRLKEQQGHGRRSGSCCHVLTESDFWLRINDGQVGLGCEVERAHSQSTKSNHRARSVSNLELGLYTSSERRPWYLES